VDELELAMAPATEQARLLRAREISSRELVELYLARIARLDATLGSYVTVLEDRARGAARAADQRLAAGEDVGPLHGVPISIKDLHFLEGARLTMGTASWADNVAPMDEVGVARLLAAGAIPLGKTNVPELGTIAHTDTSLLGPCATPWDPSRNAGGSSGGAGAALAAGLCALAQGSDGGGSIRIPAAVNGVVGLKPARDRISLGPLVGETSFGLSTSGALTRTVADAALALDVMAGPSPGDPGMAPPPARPFLEEVAGDPAPGRIGVTRQAPFTPDGLHHSVEAALDRAIEVLEGLGHRVEEVELPVSEDLAEQLRVIWSSSLAAQPFDQDRYEPVNRYLVEVANRHAAPAVPRAQFALQSHARAAVRATAHLDAVLAPVVSGPSRPTDHYRDWDGEAIFLDQTAWVALTPFVNVTGQPAISLPLYHDDDVGPVGVQLIGRPWDEAGLLRLAAQVERAAPWHHHVAPAAR
jgi:amidase